MAISDADLKFYRYAGDRRLTLVESLSDMSQLKSLVFAGNYGILSNYSHLSIYDLSDVLSAPQVVSFQLSAFGLSSFPNPFNDRLSITFQLPQAGPVALELYDPLGRLVDELTPKGWFQAGEQRLNWDAAGLPSGKYLLRLRSPSAESVNEVVKLK